MEQGTVLSKRSYLCGTLATLCLGFTPVVSASELVQRDLMFSVGEEPTHFSYTLTSPGASRAGSDSFSSNLGASVGGRYSFAGPGDATGLVVGGGLDADQASYGSIGHYTGYGLHLDAGYAWAMTDSWTIGSRVILGYGRATLDLQANNVFPSITTTGSTIGYAAAVDLDYSVTDRIAVMLDLGYAKSTATLSGSGVNLKLSTSGLTYALGVTYRFSVAPRPLE
jgi:hypothetical protein